MHPDVSPSLASWPLGAAPAACSGQVCGRVCLLLPACRSALAWHLAFDSSRQLKSFHKHSTRGLQQLSGPWQPAECSLAESIVIQQAAASMCYQVAQAYKQLCSLAMLSAHASRPVQCKRQHATLHQ